MKFSLDNSNTSNNIAQDSSGLDDEITNFSNMLIKVDDQSDPLDFWKVHCAQFPVLAVFC